LIAQFSVFLNHENYGTLFSRLETELYGKDVEYSMQATISIALMLKADKGAESMPRVYKTANFKAVSS
jgi:hypothetical protein